MKQGANNNDALNSLCIEMQSQLYLMKEAWEIWGWIADNAKAINAANYKVLVTLQRMALNESILAVCRIHDLVKYSETVSIKSAVRLLKETELLNRDAFVKYLVTLGVESDRWKNVLDEDLVKSGTELIDKAKPTENNCNKLKKWMAYRHENLAHNAVSKEEVELFESDFEYLTSWADSFIEMTKKAFGTPALIDDVRSAKTSLKRLCEDAGIIEKT